MASEQVVVCAGRCMKSECALAISDLDFGGEGSKYRFVMREWLSQEQFRQAALLWIVDDPAPWDEVDFALSHAIPLLVPAGNALLMGVCVSGNCGLWYRDEIDARLCLEFLLSNDAIRERMGANGRAYLTLSRAFVQSRHNLVARRGNRSAG